MQSVGERREEEQQTKTLKAQEREAKAETKDQNQGAAKRLTDRLLTLIELAGVAGIGYLLRKPLEKLSVKILIDIYKAAKLIKNGLKDVSTDFEAAELRIRADIRDRYFKDPILAHKLGPGLYNNLIGGGWDVQIYGPEGDYPSSVEDLFIAGTGRGATSLRGSVIKGVSLQVLALTKWFIGNSADLQQLGAFPKVPPIVA